MTDNWNWCSGNKDGYCKDDSGRTDERYPTQDQCEEAYGADNWKSGLGDHRYTPDSGSGNIIANCQSYDEPSFSIEVDAAT